MHKILGHYDFCKVFFDIILIHSDSFENHVEHVTTTMNRLSKYNPPIKLEKTQWLCKQLPFLGYILRDDNISVNPSN